MEFVHLDETFVNSDTCAFGLTLHLFGTYRNADCFDSSGFLYKTLVTASGGALTATATANGPTLTMQNQSFLVTIYYNADGSVSTATFSEPEWKFTARGGGIVYLDTGTVTFDGDDNIVFEAGPHQDLDGDVDALCAALG